MRDLPLSLYVHLPWCIKKCPYCDFNSHEFRTVFPEKNYIDALMVDLSQQIDVMGQREIISIFIGGGTPSLFSADSIQRLLDGIARQFTLAPDAEITLEANPGASSQQNFAGFHQAGVNRISIGVQSFSNPHLQALGRIHDAQAAIDAVTCAQAAGFENINIDLMYGLPLQTLQQAAQDVEQAIQLRPNHISYYQLTIEPNTRFFRYPPTVPDSEFSWAMQQQGIGLLAQSDFRQYEVSAFASGKFECIHNLNYWQFGDYIGIGAGAHQKTSCSARGIITRCEKPSHPQDYITRALGHETLGVTRTLAGEEVIFEFLMNALRLKQGFSRQQFERHTGLEFEHLAARIKPLQDEALLDVTDCQVRCTRQGYDFLDELLQRMIPECA